MAATKTRTSNADEFWALADQYLVEANDPSASPEQAEYARSLYAQAVHDAEAAEGEAADAKWRAATKRGERTHRLRALIDHPNTPEPERAVAQRMLDKLKDAAYWQARRYGANYDHAGMLTVKDIAAQVRAEIKLTRQLAAETASIPAEPGEIAAFDPIGTMPEQIKVSVKSRRYAGGQSIDINLTGIPEAWGFVPAAEPSKYRIHDSSPALKAVYAALMAVVESHNHDGSDLVSGYSDRRFYGFVNYDLPEDIRPN